jgi:hypothetical protein
MGPALNHECSCTHWGMCMCVRMCVRARKLRRWPLKVSRLHRVVSYARNNTCLSCTVGRNKIGAHTNLRGEEIIVTSDTWFLQYGIISQLERTAFFISICLFLHLCIHFIYGFCDDNRIGIERAIIIFWCLVYWCKHWKIWPVLNKEAPTCTDA